jgi:hypothetical protein
MISLNLLITTTSWYICRFDIIGSISFYLQYIIVFTVYHFIYSISYYLQYIILFTIYHFIYSITFYLQYIISFLTNVELSTKIKIKHINQAKYERSIINN